MIEYIERTRAYYAAQGYAPYVWASHDSTPFAAPAAPLAASRLALISTAAPCRPEQGDQGPGAAYNAAAKFFEVYRVPRLPRPNLRISHIAYDRVHCRAEDPATWLPLAALEQAQAAGEIGALADNVIGLPTNRSQRVTREQDAPAVLDAVRDLAAQVALLVPT